MYFPGIVVEFTDPSRGQPFCPAGNRKARMAAFRVGLFLLIDVAKNERIPTAPRKDDAWNVEPGLAARVVVVEVQQRGPMALIRRIGERIDMCAVLLPPLVVEHVERLALGNLRSCHGRDAAVDLTDDKIFPAWTETHARGRADRIGHLASGYGIDDH